MVDARIRRTDAILRTTILSLAGTAPISHISVSELTRAAGINRATFYSHYISPQDLLGAVLRDDLDRMRGEDLRRRAEVGGTDADANRATIQAVVDHIRRYESIYRHALVDATDKTTHHALAAHFEHSVHSIFAQLPTDSIPNVDHEIMAGYLANGLVGAIESWLARPDVSEEQLIATIEEATPLWLR